MADLYLALAVAREDAASARRVADDLTRALSRSAMRAIR